FVVLADLFLSDQNAAGLESLLKAHRPHAAADPELFYYEARAKVLLKQPAEAAALLQKAYQKQTNEVRRRGYVTRLVLVMAEAGQGLEGYRLAPDKSAAFEALANQLLYQKKDKELAALLDEHGKD